MTAEPLAVNLIHVSWCVDVQYLLTGAPAGNAIAQDEAELLSAYRRLDEKSKARLLGQAEGMEVAAKPDGR